MPPRDAVSRNRGCGQPEAQELRPLAINFV